MENTTVSAETTKKTGPIVVVLVVIVSVLLVAVLALGALYLYPKLTEEEVSPDQIAADQVIALINTLEGKTITVASENEITLINMEYETLTTPQKLLVTNRAVLNKAMSDLQLAKDQAVADELMMAIDSIDESALTTDSSQINLLLNKYEALTDSQKALVTNKDKLLEYQQIIQSNVNREAVVAKATKLANNFPGYTGKWGDFGSHINADQGMIEKVLQRDFNFRKYFYCETNPNYLDMYASRFSRDTDGFGIARCSIHFTGIAKSTYEQRTVYGEVVIKNDGSLYFTMHGMY